MEQNLRFFYHRFRYGQYYISEYEPLPEFQTGTFFKGSNDSEIHFWILSTSHDTDRNLIYVVIKLVVPERRLSIDNEAVVDIAKSRNPVLWWQFIKSPPISSERSKRSQKLFIGAINWTHSSETFYPLKVFWSRFSLSLLKQQNDILANLSPDTMWSKMSLYCGNMPSTWNIIVFTFGHLVRAYCRDMRIFLFGSRSSKFQISVWWVLLGLCFISPKGKGINQPENLIINDLPIITSSKALFSCLKRPMLSMLSSMKTVFVNFSPFLLLSYSFNIRCKFRLLYRSSSEKMKAMFSCWHSSGSTANLTLWRFFFQKLSDYPKNYTEEALL